MNDRAVHPNTKAILDAWRRLSSDADNAIEDPKVADFPNVLGSLFVIKRADDGIWPFTNAGKKMVDVLGRELIDQDFLKLWRGRDIDLVSAQLNAIRFGSAPGIIRGRGETLSGQRLEIEIALAPLKKKGQTGDRLLGLYQMLGGENMLEGRPVWRHAVSAVYPPETPIKEPYLRLVASNE